MNDNRWSDGNFITALIADSLMNAKPRPLKVRLVSVVDFDNDVIKLLVQSNGIGCSPNILFRIEKEKETKSTYESISNRWELMKNR